MRWTFRRLLEMDGALPIMVVLRDLARCWQEPETRGGARALDTFLDECVAAELGEGWKGGLLKFLVGRQGPRPVLLVDGWDELGPLGEELRRKLVGFLSEHPHALVVVSSRPYGEGRPSGSDRFEVLDIQPLSEGEIGEFADRFFTICYGEDARSAGREGEKFLKALQRTPEALGLARTALLLTMMLLISRSRPLPDKRHLLYEACIDNLLNALPEQRASEGVQDFQGQWRPVDSEERLRVVAALAFSLQSSGYREKGRSAIVRAWDETVGLLPESWPERHKWGFLRWLTGAAGLLLDRADWTLAFAHLSFQEFLTAWHLNATVEGPEDRVRCFRDHLKDVDWWETLLLWGAMVGRQSQERLEPVLSSITDTSDNGLCFVGMMLADGVGSESTFVAWTKCFLNVLNTHWPDHADLCARAWAMSRQEYRKASLAELIRVHAQSMPWTGWARLNNWIHEASLSFQLPRLAGDSLCSEIFPELMYNAERPTVQLIAHALTDSSLPLLSRDELFAELPGGSEITSSEHKFVALRIFGVLPSMLNMPIELDALYSWPGPRRNMGLRFQLAVLCGASRDDLLQAAAKQLSQPTRDTELQTLSRDLNIVFPRSNIVGTSGPLFFEHPPWKRTHNLSTYRYYFRYFARDLSFCFRELIRNLSMNYIRKWHHLCAQAWAHDREFALARDLSLRLAHLSTEDLASDWGLDSMPDWFVSYVPCEVHIVGSEPRRMELFRDRFRNLFQHYEKETSWQLGSEFSPYLTSVIAELSDPLWRALVSLQQGRSTTTERALLADLVARPEKREAPLSWCLRYIVRGDIILSDRSVLTLDELSDELGLPRLPYF